MMKKTVSLLISVLLLLACFSAPTYAEDVFSHSWTVTVDPYCTERIAVIRVAYDESGPMLYTENGQYRFYPDAYLNTGLLMPVEDTNVYVPDGGSYYFTILPQGSYRFDQTTRFKALPQDYALQFVTDEDLEDEISIPLEPYETIAFSVFADGTPVTARPATEDDVVYDVKLDVYRLENITENMYIKCYNLQQESLSGIKDFLVNFYNFFIELLNWFFGLNLDLK